MLSFDDYIDRALIFSSLYDWWGLGQHSQQSMLSYTVRFTSIACFVYCTSVTKLVISPRLVFSQLFNVLSRHVSKRVSPL